MGHGNTNQWNGPDLTGTKFASSLPFSERALCDPYMGRAVALQAMRPIGSLRTRT